MYQIKIKNLKDGFKKEILIGRNLKKKLEEKIKGKAASSVQGIKSRRDKEFGQRL